jgi:ceramide glucosyltransferase
MFPLVTVFAGLGLLILLASTAHALCVLCAALHWSISGRRSIAASSPPRPVTILKPLCGAEEGLYENLRSFCEQDYPSFEIVLGVQNADDTALAVARCIIADYPELSIRIVIDERSRGSNRKVSNLRNMVEHAAYDWWVIADSDARVTPCYLSNVTAPLQISSVGLVTCLYRDVPSATIWSRLGAMYINDWFIPSVVLAQAFGRRDYVSGQTICVRRDTIETIGGLSALNDHLADDYQLGEMVRRSGFSVVLSQYVPDTRHHEASLTDLLNHEIRWMRTIAVLEPSSFRWLFLSFNLPFALLGLLLSTGALWAHVGAAVLAAIVALLRIFMHCRYRGGSGGGFYNDLWLIPIRDALTVYTWARALRASRIVWRGVEFRVTDEGIMQRIPDRLS